MTASVNGRNFRVFWSTFFRSSGRLLLMAFQSFRPPAYIRAGRRHSPIAARRHLLSRETGFETARSSFWRAPPCPPVAPARRFWLEVDSLAEVAESECCEPPEAAAGEHSPPGDEYFPALEARMEEILNRSRSYRVHRSVRVPALLRGTPVRSQTPRRYLSGARILRPGLETGSANPLAAEPSPPANRVFLFSQRSDAMRPESSFIQSS
jgi:hypothetical protein